MAHGGGKLGAKSLAVPRAHGSDESQDIKEPVPRRLLLLHNFSALFVNKSIGVIVGTCIQQLLIGLLFLILLREPEFVRNPEAVHYQYLRTLSPQGQVATYGFVWLLLLIMDCSFAIFAQRRLLKATHQLVESIELETTQRLMLYSPSGSPSPSEARSSESEEGAELGLQLEEGSILNPIREELSETIKRKSESEERQSLVSESIVMNKLSKSTQSRYSETSALLKREPRLVIDSAFLRYVGWQVVFSAFSGNPAWAVPDVISASHIWLIDIFDKPTFPEFLQHFPAIILAIGNLVVATITIVFINRSLIRQKQKARAEETESEEKDGNLTPKSTESKEHSKTSLAISVESHLSRDINKGKTFWQFAAANILLSLGLAVGMSFEMLVDYIAEDLVSGSYILEVLSAIVVTLVVAFLQWKCLDTSYDPAVSADFLINFRRFLSTSLSFLVAWSFKYAVIDTKDFLLRLSKPDDKDLTSISPQSSNGINAVSNSTIASGIPGIVAAPSDHIVGLSMNSVSFLNPVGEGVRSVQSTFIHLPILGEFIVALTCMLVFGTVVGLVTLWQNNANKKRHRLRYRKYIIKLVILACGTVIGWSWAVLFSVIYGKVIATWAPPEKPWVSVCILIAFILIVLKICCAFAMIIVFMEERAKEKWRLKMRHKKAMKKHRLVKDSFAF